MKMSKTTSHTGHGGRNTPPLNGPGDMMQAENDSLKQRVAELEKLVVRDTLTPLYNRRYFMEELERLCVRAQRHDTQYGLIYIDVDGLKSINDRYGHNAGDELLITVAAALQRRIRRFDIAARMGGDEFAILLDSVGAAMMDSKIAALRQQVHDCALDFDGDLVKPCISVGYTMVDPQLDASKILAQADADMYRQKRQKS